jgi:hypothetical protein
MLNQVWGCRKQFSKGPPKNHPTKFGLIWFSGFRKEDLIVKDYDA